MSSPASTIRREPPPQDMAVSAWEQRFELLIQFKKTHGHLTVPLKGDTQKLHQWMVQQRRLLKRGALPQSCIDRLDALGFVWNPFDDTWSAMLRKLIELQETHGCVDIPFLFKTDEKLAIWANRQKSLLAAGELSPERALQFASVGLGQAKRVHRGSNANVVAEREKVMLEYAAHIAQFGTGFVAPDRAQESLFQRLRRLRYIANRNPQSHLRAQLTKMGAYAQYADVIWEEGFSLWSRYVRDTGDYACLAAPPRNVAIWVEETRALLTIVDTDRLSLPLATRYARATKKPLNKLRQRLALLEKASIVQRRLLHSGFVRWPTVLQEHQLMAAHVSRALSVPAPAKTSLKLLLKCLSIRKQQGLLSQEETARLAKLGLAWNTQRRRWYLANQPQRVQGARVFAPPRGAATAPKPRVSFSAPKAAASTTGMLPSNTPPAIPSSSPPFVGPKPLRKLRNLPLLYAVKQWFLKHPRAFTENELRKIQDLRDLVLHGGEMKLALLTLLQSGWLTMELGDFPDGAKCAFRRVAN